MGAGQDELPMQKERDPIKTEYWSDLLPGGEAGSCRSLLVASPAQSVTF